MLESISSWCTHGAVFGATASGLIGWKEGKQQTLTVGNGLPCDGVNALVAGPSGSAVVVYAVWTRPDCASGTATMVGPARCRCSSGPTIRFDGVIPAFTPSREPHDLLTDACGLRMVPWCRCLIPAHLDANVVAPPVHVEEVIADRKSYAATERPSSSSSDARHRNRLYGVELRRSTESPLSLSSWMATIRDWQEPGTRRRPFTVTLRPGRLQISSHRVE